MQDADTAVDRLQRAAGLAPGDAGLALELGLALQQSGDDAAAHAAFARARSIAPGDRRVRWAQALALPAFVEDDGAARSALARFDAFLGELERDAAQGDPAAELDAATVTLPFALHYLADDVLARPRRYAALVAAAARRACAIAPLEREALSGRRIRVGFVSSYLRDHVVTRYLGGLVTSLPGDTFERLAWFTGEAPDERTREIAAGVDRFIHATGSFSDVAGAIRDARLDALVHLDVGLDPRAIALAALRLAPVQVALPGHPASTGLDSVDWFVSSEALEPPDAQRDYSESLACLPGFGAVPWAPPAAGDGAWMHALRRGPAPLLACPQNPMKMVPAFDEVVADILARTGARLVLFERGARLTTRVRERMLRALARRGVAADALHVESLHPYAEYLGGIAAADLVLDTPVFSGGATSLDALGVGAAVLAFEGATARARQTSGMLRLIDAGELVAPDATRYAAIARELLEDRPRLAALRQRIAKRSAILFEGSGARSAFARFLRERAG
jgi:predicted O-linked N-acetylglucosamine transferase (SPINDLY family)